MAKFIKEVTKEVLDVESLGRAVTVKKAMLSYGKPRIVMSTETYRALEAENAAVRTRLRFPYTMLECVTFCNCPIDRNDSLSFGEVLFTREL